MRKLLVTNDMTDGCRELTGGTTLDSIWSTLLGFKSLPPVAEKVSPQQTTAEDVLLDRW